jgi:hypothetical protein
MRSIYTHYHYHLKVMVFSPQLRQLNYIIRPSYMPFIVVLLVPTWTGILLWGTSTFEIYQSAKPQSDAGCIWWKLERPSSWLQSWTACPVILLYFCSLLQCCTRYWTSLKRSYGILDGCEGLGDPGRHTVKVRNSNLTNKVTLIVLFPGFNIHSLP